MPSEIGDEHVITKFLSFEGHRLDGNAILGDSPLPGLLLNAGWGYAGFKATPASGYCYAHLLARDEPHPTAKDFRLDRFMHGRPIDEKGVGAQPNLH